MGGGFVRFMLNIEESADGSEHRSMEDPPLAWFLFQSSGLVTWLWLLVRVWLGAQWLRLGWGVLTAPPAAGDSVLVVGAVAHVVLGLALIAGAFVGIAATAGLIENVVAYAWPGGFAGDPLQLIAATLLILAWKNAGYVGVDKYLLRLFGRHGVARTSRMSRARREPPRQRNT